MLKYVSFAIIVLLFASCDKVQEPFLENHSQNIDTATYVKKVLIEDFTGARCGNCPRSHEKIEELGELYGDKVIAIAIHSGYFAIPTADYPADYRTTAGNELTTFFGVTEYPNGVINRVQDAGQYLQAYTAWGSTVSAELALAPELGIKITNSYNSTNRTVSISADVKFLTSIDEQLKICFYITEDSIVSPQTDYSLTPNKVDNYVHMHMLRTAVNGTWGESLPLASYALGETVNVSRSYVLNPVWNENHCHVIVYLYKESDNVILQAEEKKVN